MNNTVYLGANEGNDPGLRKAVEELKVWIGNSGNTLWMRLGWMVRWPKRRIDMIRPW